MGGAKSIPVVGEAITVIDSGVKVIGAGAAALVGDKDAAKDLLKDAGDSWVDYSERSVIVAIARAAIHSAKGDEKEADRVMKKMGNSVLDVVDNTPVAGHIKGVVHYAMGDKEHGNACMKGASRTLAVAGAGVLTGGLGVGAVLGGVAGASSGVAYDASVSLIESCVEKEDRPYGIMASIHNAIESAKKDDGCGVFKSVIDIGVAVGSDFALGAAAAKAAQGKASRTTNKSNKVQKPVTTKKIGNQIKPEINRNVSKGLDASKCTKHLHKIPIGQTAINLVAARAVIITGDRLQQLTTPNTFNSSSRSNYSYSHYQSKSGSNTKSNDEKNSSDRDHSTESDNGGNNSDSDDSTESDNGGNNSDSDDSTESDNGGNNSDSDDSTESDNRGNFSDSEESDDGDSLLLNLLIDNVFSFVTESTVVVALKDIPRKLNKAPKEREALKKTFGEFHSKNILDTAEKFLKTLKEEKLDKIKSGKPFVYTRAIDLKTGKEGIGTNEQWREYRRVESYKSKDCDSNYTSITNARKGNLNEFPRQKGLLQETAELKMEIKQLVTKKNGGKQTINSCAEHEAIHNLGITGDKTSLCTMTLRFKNGRIFTMKRCDNCKQFDFSEEKKFMGEVPTDLSEMPVNTCMFTLDTSPSVVASASMDATYVAVVTVSFLSHFF